MRFVSVFLVAVLVVGGVLGFVIQQRATQIPKLSAPAVITPVLKTPTVADSSTTGDTAVTSKAPLQPQTSITSGEANPTVGITPATPKPSEPLSKVKESQTRISDVNYVQVSITPISLRDSEDMISFDVSLNTHSVDLSRYNLEKLARLIIDGQSPIVDGFQWVAKIDDSHHRSGVLKLPAIDAQGKERISSTTKELVLVLDGVASNGIRSFTWDTHASLLQ